MAANVPEAAGKFILPAPLTDKALMETARVFLERATPLAAEFTRRAMPADFLTELRLQLEVFEETNGAKLRSRATQDIAGAGTRDCVAEGDRLVAELKVIMQNKFADNAGLLRTWSMVVRQPRARARAADAGTAETTPAPAKSGE
ncbi:MAG: hypothetical protein ACKV2V_22405 [Blastocatellia bacterium]